MKSVADGGPEEEFNFRLCRLATELISIIFGSGVVRASLIFQHMTAVRPWLVFALCPVGFAIIVFLTRKVFPGAQGSGIPQATAAPKMRDVADVDTVLSLRIVVGKFLLTLLGFPVGASIGKEGPTVQIGCATMNRCATMNLCGRIGLQSTQALQRVLILAGGAAGITCAFNAPIAGIVFAIEEMARSFNEEQSRAIILAAFASGVTLLIVPGYEPYFGISHAELPLSWVWLLVPLCAVVGGLAGGLFARILVTPARFMPGPVNRLALRRPVGFAALCGLLLAIIGFVSHGHVFDASYGQARDGLLGVCCRRLNSHRSNTWQRWSPISPASPAASLRRRSPSASASAQNSRTSCRDCRWPPSRWSAWPGILWGGAGAADRDGDRH